MTKKKKILIVCSIPVILILGCVLYIRLGGYFVIDKNIRKEFFAHIKDSPQLPDRIYQIYDTMYPNSLEPSSLKHFLFHRVGSDNRRSCACTEAVYEGIYPLYVETWRLIPVISITEQNFTQKECLSYYIKKRIEENKIIVENFHSLSDTEIVELLLKIENPSYFNKKRFPERVNEKVKEVLYELKNK